MKNCHKFCFPRPGAYHVKAFIFLDIKGGGTLELASNTIKWENGSSEMAAECIASVIKVMGTNKVVLNRGAKHGLKVGEVFGASQQKEPWSVKIVQAFENKSLAEFLRKPKDLEDSKIIGRRVFFNYW